MSWSFFHARYDGIQYVIDGEPAKDFGSRAPSPQGGDEGIFASWRWDGQRLSITNDAYGMFPLYYFSNASEICISPSIATLISRGASQKLNYPALAVFLRLGFFLKEDTPFRDIHALPPKVSLVWSKQGLDVHSSIPAPSVSSLSRDAAMAAYQDLFAAAIGRQRPDEPCGILLSGGRDSRHILFELQRQNRLPVLGATTDRQNSNDGEIAQRLAAALSVSHLRLGSYRPTLRTERQNLQETHFCSLEHSWIHDLRDALVGKVKCLWDGLGGDVLSAGLYSDEGLFRLLRRGAFQDIADRLFENQDAYLMMMLIPSIYKEVSEDIARERLAEELQKHQHAPNPIGSFYFWNRTRRVVALSPYGVFRDFKVYTPYLDSSVFALLSSLPAEMFHDHRFHDDTIARAYPGWKDIPFAEKRPPVDCRSYRRRDLFGIAIHASRWIKPEYLLPRLIRAAFDRQYYYRAAPYIIEFPLYLKELERLQTESHRGRDGQMGTTSTAASTQNEPS